MADEPDGLRKHFILEGVTETEPYRYPGAGGGDRLEIPARDRAQHGAVLQRQIGELRGVAENAREAQQAAGMEDGLGLQVEFESFPDIELAFESLARDHWGIELLNVRHEDNRTHATVFVPDGKLDHFERLIRAYLAEARDKAGRRRDNQRLIDAIREIRAASLRALWTDSTDVYPTLDDGAVWWEVWLPIRGDRRATVGAFRERAGAQGMDVAPGELIFPERTVLMVRASVEEMQRSMVTLNSIAELRRPKETADFFDSLEREEQAEWLDDFLNRARFAADGDGTPYVCLLDTGVNRGHPMLAPALGANDLYTVEPGWGTDDADGHGTEIAGLALAGDWNELLAGTGPVEVEHRLESVKLIPRDRMPGRGPRHHGHLTVEAVARPEVTAPLRRRVFGMAVTARDDRDRGRPSAWSAAIDSLAVDFDSDGDNPRLLLVSAGNVSDSNAWSKYPDSNDTDGVHDPAQAWNALTVGACTDLVRISEPDAGDYAPIAPEGGLSPFSITSLTWEPHWPLKPDVVFEGGNAAEDPISAVWLHSLSLLTTHHLPANRLFTTTNATSAATALASRFAAQVMAIYPGLRPETIRALIVHSAEWTDTMKRQFLPANREPNKADRLRLVQRCGFGVPDIARARWSVENSLTMVIEERLHPFKRAGSGSPTLRDMQLHDLPWPLDVLEGLGEAPVEMRVLPSEIADVDGVTEQRGGTISAFNGPEPLLRTLTSPDEESACIAGWLRERRDEGYQPQEIGVFVRSEAELDRAIKGVEDAGFSAVVLSKRPGGTTGSVAVGTMHLAKGLEFRAVVVAGCDDEVLPLQSRIESVADEADLDEVYNTERHLLYVACTRARDRLLVTGVDPASEFLDDFR